MKIFLIGLLSVTVIMSAQAQMWNGQDTLYGNEWIDYSKTYFKIKITEDGVYRIENQTLLNTGFPAGSVAAGEWRLFRNGEQEAIFTSTSGVFGGADFFEFYGRKNRGEVDFYLFADAEEEQINPWYSMFNDTAVYYLTWGTGGQAMRYNVVQNDLNNLPPAEPFCWQNSEEVFWQGGVAKKYISDEIQYSWFDGIGYVRSYGSSTEPVPLNLPKIFNSGPDALAHVRYACNLGDHHQQILLNDSIFAEDQFNDFRIIDRKFAVKTSFLKPTSTFKLLSPLNDRNGLALASIRYPRQFDFENGKMASFELDASTSEKYLEIQGFDVSGGSPVLWDLTNKTRLVTIPETGITKAKIAPSNVLRNLVLISPAATKNVSSLQSVQFQNPTDGGTADYLIISNKALYNDPATNADHVAEYANYRRSAAGGSHGVKVMDINDLYEQFAYGVRFHPIAVRNFLNWAKHTWPQTEHALIIGKALDFTQFRSPAQQDQMANSLFFVPTYSFPGADMPFVMRSNQISDPIMAIGRLAVTKPSEIRNDLDKVINPYLVLTALLAGLAILISFSKLPDINEAAEAPAVDAAGTTRTSVWQFPHLLLGVLAMFLYVGVEVIAGDTIINYGVSQGISLEQAKHFTTYTLYAMLIGYVLGIVTIPKYISQQKALQWSATLGVLLTLLALVTTGFTSVLCVALLGLANALMWPAIFPLAIAGLGKFTKLGSALVVMGIAGGAILPLLYGRMADSIGTQAAYAIALPCYLFILYFAWRGWRAK